MEVSGFLPLWARSLVPWHGFLSILVGQRLGRKKKMVLGGPRQISATAKKLHIRKEKQRNVRGMVKLASNFPTTPVENMCTILFVIRVIEMCSPPDTRRVKQNAFTVLHMKQSRPNRGGNWSRLRVRIGWASAHVLLT